MAASSWRSIASLLTYNIIILSLYVSTSLGDDRRSDEYFSNWIYPEGRTDTKQQGELYHVKCELHDVKETDVVRVVLTQGNTSRTISENGELKPPFSQLRRYKVEFRHGPKVFADPTIAEVTIMYVMEGVQAEDSGIFSCFNANNDIRNRKENNLLNVTVHGDSANVGDVHIIAILPDGSDEILLESFENLFVEENSIRFGCVAVANGSRFRVALTMTIVDFVNPYSSSGTLPVDVSHLFSYSGGTKSEYMTDSGLERYSSYNKSVLAKTSSVADFYDKRLTCNAKFDKPDGYYPVSASTILARKPPNPNGTNRKEHFGFKICILLALISLILVF